MTIRKISSLLLVSVLLFAANIAHAADYKTHISLALGSNGNLANEAYTLTVPESLTVSAKGWNSIGQIHAVKESTTDFNTAKKLVVTAVSSNDFKLVSGTNSISYTLTTAEGGSKTTEFTFSAADLNKSGGTSQDIGISLTWESTQASGTYEDTITYKASVEDATATSGTTTVTWTADDITNNLDGITVKYGGVTLTASASSAGGGTFTLESGKFTKIVITATGKSDLAGNGWTTEESSGNYVTTWTNTDGADSVSFTGGDLSVISKIDFTIAQ